MSFHADDCDLDLVIEMEEMGVGVEEILQYAKGCFSRDDVRSLIHALEERCAVPAGSDG